SFSSGCYKSFIPEIFTASIAYHAVVLLHTVCDPCSEMRVLPVAVVVCRRNDTASRPSTGCMFRNLGNVPTVQTRPGCRPDGSQRSAWDAEGVWRETPFGSCSSTGSGGQRPPTTEALKSSSKRPTEASTQQADDLARRHKKVKILSRRHKSRHDEGGSRSHSKGKEPTAPVERLEMPVESAEEATLPVFHRPRSMKDLYGTKVRKDDARYYAPYMSDLAHQDPNKEMQVSCFVQNQHVQMVLFDRVHNAGRLITFMDYRITSLQQEIDVLKSGEGPEVVAAAEERAWKKSSRGRSMREMRRFGGSKHLIKN
ncbi:hypothetical protein B296_00020638, partial [Ensete ventricosum]